MDLRGLYLNIQDSYASASLAYVLYVEALGGYLPSLISFLASLSLIPILQRVFIRFNIQEYRGLVRGYLRALNPLAASWLLIASSISIALNNQLPLILAPPFASIAIAASSPVGVEECLCYWPLSIGLALALTLVKQAPLGLALISVPPYVMSILALDIAKGASLKVDKRPLATPLALICLVNLVGLSPLEAAVVDAVVVPISMRLRIPKCSLGQKC